MYDLGRIVDYCMVANKTLNMIFTCTFIDTSKRIDSGEHGQELSISHLGPRKKHLGSTLKVSAEGKSQGISRTDGGWETGVRTCLWPGSHSRLPSPIGQSQVVR